jgi:hypothetical protein
MGTIKRPDYVIPSQVFFRDVDGQMVLLNLDTEQYFGLDAVGANIITRLTESSWDDAIAALLVDYEVDETVLRSDVEELVAALIEAGLLERTTVSGAVGHGG